jgi:tetratricopeptide (TPR) repeat protein
LLELAKRHLEKGRFKQALKDARAAYRRQPTAESRLFLEHAMIARARELFHYDRPACRAVVEELLRLGVTEPAVEAGLPDLLASMGLLERLPSADRLSVEERTRLQLRMADQAVLHPADVPASHAELRAAAQRVRSALEFVEKGDEASALASLQGIGRESPLADWRFFVRGLAAYYRCDNDETDANWKRLDPDRAAAAIAGVLLAFSGQDRGEGKDDRYATAIRALEDGIGMPGVVSQLKSLAQRLKNESRTPILPALRLLRRTLGRHHPELWQRVSDCVAEQLSWAGRIGLFDRAIRVLEPPAIDPFWNRARALLRDRAADFDFLDSIPFWQAYIADLEKVPGLSAEERRVAQGLVWLHTAGIESKLIRKLDNCTCGNSHKDEIKDVLANAKQAFEACLKRLPRHAPAYRRYAAVYRDLGKLKEAAAIQRRAVKHLPDDGELAVSVAHDFLDEGLALEALEYAQRAKQLMPFNSDVTELTWEAHVEAVRELTVRGETDAVPAHFDAADSIMPARRDYPEILVSRALFEHKLGRKQQSQRWVDRALAQVEEPAPVWMMLTIEAKRYGLSAWDVHPFEVNWFRALKGRRRSDTAGRMSRIMWEHLWSVGAGATPDEHVERLLRYLRWAGRVDWRHHDLREVCRLLEKLEESKLLRKFVRIGCRKFPHEAIYCGLAADLEIQRGQGVWRLGRAWKHAKRALELARASGDADSWETVHLATSRLRMIEARMLIGRRFRAGRLPDVEEVADWEDADWEDAP